MRTPAFFVAVVYAIILCRAAAPCGLQAAPDKTVSAPRGGSNSKFPFPRLPKLPPLPATRKAAEARSPFAHAVKGTGGWRINPNERDADRVSEPEWFATLPATAQTRLRSGDILLKKVYDRGYTSNEVVQAQTAFHATHGTRRTEHAMIYVGNGRVAESSLSRDGLWQDKVSRRKGQTLLVYRRVGPGATLARRRAVAYALKWAPYVWVEPKKPGEVGRQVSPLTYALGHAVLTFPFSTDFDEGAKARAVLAARGEAPGPSMMCSEFVTFCYQTTEPPSLLLDARRTAPIRLEEELNRSPLFVFVGTLKP
ncbi:MAG TPA: hypothetical protein VK970_09775 [Candidatus Methylacidiphilales bacterium]|nr:hypothetical protein [Candidatus Methylacidiphilales bacterium]